MKKMDGLEGIDPQSGMALLQAGIVPSLVYFMQVTPPNFSMQAFKKYDEHVRYSDEVAIPKKRSETAPMLWITYPKSYEETAITH